MVKCFLRDLTYLSISVVTEAPRTARPYDCRRSMFGCCADQYTTAVDPEKSNCLGKYSYLFVLIKVWICFFVAFCNAVWQLWIPFFCLSVFFSWVNQVPVHFYLLQLAYLFWHIFSWWRLKTILLKVRPFIRDNCSCHNVFNSFQPVYFN